MFSGRLVLIADNAPDIWTLAEPLEWNGPPIGRIIVPAGFRTDLASIPRLLRNLPDLDPDGISRSPAVLHDFLYCTQPCDRETADRTLQAALVAQGASRFAAWVYYKGVHWGGGHPWAGYTAALNQRKPS